MERATNDNIIKFGISKMMGEARARTVLGHLYVPAPTAAGAVRSILVVGSD